MRVRASYVTLHGLGSFFLPVQGYKILYLHRKFAYTNITHTYLPAYDFFLGWNHEISIQYLRFDLNIEVGIRYSMGEGRDG